MARVTPHGPRLALFVKSPHIMHAIGDRVAEDAARRGPHVLEAGCEDDFVGREVEMEGGEVGLLFGSGGGGDVGIAIVGISVRSGGAGGGENDPVRYDPED